MLLKMLLVLLLWVRCGLLLLLLRVHVVSPWLLIPLIPWIIHVVLLVLLIGVLLLLLLPVALA